MVASDALTWAKWWITGKKGNGFWWFFERIAGCDNRKIVCFEDEKWSRVDIWNSEADKSINFALEIADGDSEAGLVLGELLPPDWGDSSVDLVAQLRGCGHIAGK